MRDILVRDRFIGVSDDGFDDGVGLAVDAADHGFFERGPADFESGLVWPSSLGGVGSVRLRPPRYGRGGAVRKKG